MPVRHRHDAAAATSRGGAAAFHHDHLLASHHSQQQAHVPVTVREELVSRKKLLVASRMILLLAVAVGMCLSGRAWPACAGGDGGGVRTNTTMESSSWLLPSAGARSLPSDQEDDGIGSEGNDDERSVERYRTLDEYIADVSGNPRSSGSDHGADASSSTGRKNRSRTDDVIVVATVDGTMAGISRSTGKALWKRTSSSSNGNENDTATPSAKSEAPDLSSTSSTSRRSASCSDGEKSEAGYTEDAATLQIGLFAPLVSTTTTTKSGSGSGRGGDWRTAAVPSVDGRVYLTPGRDKNVPSAVSAATAVTTARELVGRSPFVDSRGRFYVGSRTATAAALDKETGEILRLVTSCGAANEAEVLPSLEGRNIVWIGRTDYSVSMFDARTGDIDVSFSTSEVLSVGDMFRGGQIGFSEENFLSDIGGGQEEWNVEDLRRHPLMLEGGNDEVSSSLLVATPSGSLALRSPITGAVEWVSDVTFETPVAYAVESSDGKSIGVDIIPDAVVPCDDKEYVKDELERQIEHMEDQIFDKQTGNAEDSEQSETIVGALDNGQLFAMPLQRRKKSFLPGLPHPLPSSRTQQGANHASSRQWNNRGPRHHPHSLGGETGDWQHPRSNTHEKQQDKGSVMASTSTSLAMINSACHPGHPNFPACLVGSRLKQQQELWKDYNGDGVPDGDGSFLDPKPDPRSDAALKALMMTGYHLNPDFFDGSLWADPDLYDDERRQQRQRSRFKAFLRIMGSWVPPAVALAFVISFELGRRERLKAEKLLLERQSQGNNDNASDLSSSKILVSDRKGKGEENVGAIKVSPRVLGYGGHGTVVYRGSLDGRSVAVKRMLKAYHASANREISLLIESDGHPNVVRYFLKEVRGDFVYLALELCQMSLHDLIGAIGEHKYWRQGKPDKIMEPNARDAGVGVINDATRDLLFQIASGVKHLHSLRIVHRDLKPQNILLAHQDKNRKERDNGVNGDGMEDKEKDPAGIDQDQQNEFICEHFVKGAYIPKISDMGLGKQLIGQSSFGLSTLNTSVGLNASGAGEGQSRDVVGAGPGSVGWQAPEVMAQRRSPEGRIACSSMMRTCSDIGCSNDVSSDLVMSEVSPVADSFSTAATTVRTSRSVDIFSLGCIFYCTIIPGSHPFGEWWERESRIMKNEPNTRALEELSVDASDLVISMIARDAKQRPTAAQVCRHPFFWQPAKRLAFLCQLSDRLEATAPTLADSIDVFRGSGDINSQSQHSIDPFLVERNASTVIGTSWDKDLDQGLLDNISRFRTYDPSSVRDLLRLIRNKYHHFDELPEGVKTSVGPNSTDVISYFEGIFPGIIMHCYHVCKDNLSEDDPLIVKYAIPSRCRESSVNVASSKSESLSSVEESHPRRIVKKEVANANVDINNNYRDLASTSTLSNITENQSDTGTCDPSSKTVPSALPESPESSTSSAFAKTREDVVETDADIFSVTAYRTTSASSSAAVRGKSGPEDIHGAVEMTGEIDQFDRVPAESTTESDTADGSQSQKLECSAEGMVIWEGSTAAKTFKCRGWYRSQDEWKRRVDSTLRKRDANVARCATDPKFRTRLCNHWDVSMGTFCPMRKKKKCIFAHGPVELRVKEGKKHRWGTLVDAEGNSSNPRSSGGEDTYGAAKSIELMREKEGKWTPKKGPNNRNTGRYRGNQSGASNKKGTASS